MRPGRGVVLKKEVCEHRSHTKLKGRLHQIVPKKLAFAYENFHAGSSCFTDDFWLAVQICVSLAHLWDRSHVLMTSQFAVAERFFR